VYEYFKFIKEEHIIESYIKYNYKNYNTNKKYKYKNVNPHEHENIKSPSVYTLSNRLPTSVLFHYFLPERDYVTFRSLLSQIRLSSVVYLSSVTFVRPTQ